MVLFTGIFKYQEEIVKKATIIVPAKTTNKRVVSATTEGPQTTLQTQKLYSSPDICGKVWQSKYQALHQEIINNKREAKFLVYSCPWTNKGCCGYGNRVYAMVSLFYLAILTDRAFLIHWKAPKPLESFLAPKSINWTFPIPLLETRKHYWRTGGHTNKALDGWLTKKHLSSSEFGEKRKFQGLFR